MKPYIFPLRFCNIHEGQALFMPIKNNQMKSQNSWQCRQEPCELPQWVLSCPHPIVFFVGGLGIFLRRERDFPWQTFASYRPIIKHMPELNHYKIQQRIHKVVSFHQPVNYQFYWSIISTVLSTCSQPGFKTLILTHKVLGIPVFKNTFLVFLTTCKKRSKSK